MRQESEGHTKDDMGKTLRNKVISSQFIFLNISPKLNGMEKKRSTWLPA